MAFLCLSFVFARLYYALTDDFRLANITYEMKGREEWEIPPLASDEKGRILSLLKQKYSYVGKGAQAYAFESEDGNYILKFFKFKHLKPSFFLELLPPLPLIEEYRSKNKARKEKNLLSMFSGYRLAYEKHRRGSGLLFIHLKSGGSDLTQKVTIKDKVGLERTIDLDSTIFVLQERAETTRKELTTLIADRDFSSAKKRIAQLFELYQEEYSNGIYDRDHGITHNTGFVGKAGEKRAIRLDVGKLSALPQAGDLEFAASDLALAATKLSLWLRSHDQEAYDALKSFIEERYRSFAGRGLNLHQ